MNFKKLLYIAAMILAVAACKDEEETETAPSLDGYLVVDGIPEFASPRETITLTASGVQHPEGGKLTYHWKISPSQSEYTAAHIVPASQPSAKHWMQAPQGRSAPFLAWDS